MAEKLSRFPPPMWRAPCQSPHSLAAQFDRQQFDQESKRVLNVALEMVCITLRTGDCDDDVKEAIAKKVIALAKAGERNPDKLCEEALKDIRRGDRRH